MPRDDGDDSSLTEILVCTHTGSQGLQTSELMLPPMDSFPTSYHKCTRSGPTLHLYHH